MSEKSSYRIAPGYEHLLPVVEDIVAHGLPGDAVTIYQARNRVVTLTRNGITLNIKAFRRPSFPNNIIYTLLRPSKARRSFEYALRLAEMNVGTPRPLAYIEKRRGCRLVDSYYISAQIEANDVRFWENAPDTDALLHAMAADLVKLHRLGIFHKDYSPGNILYTRDPDGKYHFNYIDLNRMEFGVESHRKLMRNFRCINLDLGETLRFARHYADAAGADPDTICREAERNVMAYRREKSMHRLMKSLIGKKKK